MSNSGDTVEKSPASGNEDKSPDRRERTEDLSRGSGCDLPTSIVPMDVRDTYMISVIKWIKGQRDDIPGPVPGTSFNRNYTTLYLVKGDSEGLNQHHEVWQLETASKVEKALFDEKILCSDVLKRLAGSETPIQRVLTLGIAGIGKTFSVYKFTLDWAERVANQHIDLLILMSFRELNLVRDKQHSLLTLIHDFHPTLKMLTAEQLAACKTVFVFDGLDESKMSLDFHDNDMVSDVTVTSSVDALLTNLIKGNLLPSAQLWVTTRPAAANRIPPQWVDRVTEVRGFTDAQKDEYFRRRFSDDEELANRIISHINKTRSLHILCHIPLFCWIAATVLEDMLKTDETGQLPTTPTEMFSHFILVQTRRKKKYDDETHELSQQQLMATDWEVLLNLGNLAFKHLEKGSLMFYQEDLEECGLDVNDAALYSGVCTEIFRRESVLFQRKVYSFVHLSIQEFLAAVYLFHCFTQKNVEVIKTFLPEFSPMSLRDDYIHMSPDDFQQRCMEDARMSNMSLDNFLLRALEQSLESKNGHLDLFVRFLHGLSLQSNQTLLGGLLGQTENSPEEIQRAINNLKKMDSNLCRKDPDRCINIFHCLMEMKDDSVHQEIQQYLKSGDRSKTQLSLTQCSALAYMLLMSEEVMDEFDLEKYNTSLRGRLRLLPAVRNCRKARIHEVVISETEYEVLVSALSSNPSYLVELDLTDSILSEAIVKRLCDAMKSPNCRLKSLRLDGCRLSESCCEHLASVLRYSSSLQALDLSRNDLTDSGMTMLFPGLESQQCRLKILRLRQTNLTEKSCKELSSLLGSNSSSLTELDLSSNELKNSGVKELSFGLQSPHCTLEILRLSHCLVSEEGFSCLASALRSNLSQSHLKKLDMSFNQPGGSGGEQLLSVGLATLTLDQEEEHDHSPLLLKTYACPLTLDTNTAFILLSLSENNRKVTCVREDQRYPDHPDRFQHFSQVLCREGLTGCCYCEVERSGVVGIGATYRRINRKGEGVDGVLGCNDLSWSLECNDNGYSVTHNRKTTALHVCPSGSNRVAVYVDWPAGSLSFYRVCSETHTHLYTFQTTFTEPLYIVFFLGLDSSVSLSQIEPVIPTSFSPIVHTEHTTTEYRFACPGPGLFQCSETSLVFGTSREGEVLYRTVQWEERCIPSTGRTPAGPLFDIQCPQKSICQLHLPHCAITPGYDLSVANVTDEGVYLFEPQNVTQTHVVLNVAHLSLFGLLWRKIMEYLRPTSGQVLLFLQPPGRLTRKLSVLMLPGNVSLKEVMTFYENYNKKENLESTSNCDLTSDLVYRLQCASHCFNLTIHPENVKYRLNYGPNYHPTFKVTMDLSADVVSLALMGPENNQVWTDAIELEDAGPSQPNVATAMMTRREVETLRSVRKEFIKRVSVPVINRLLDTLLDENVLNDEEMDMIRAERYREEKARGFIDMVRKKGNEASSKMIAAFHEEDPTLFDDMGLNRP